MRHDRAMNPAPDLLKLSSDASPEQVEAALQALIEDQLVVRLGEDLQLSLAGRTLRCDVLEQAGSAHRCAFEYEVMVENARRTFEASAIAQSLSGWPQRWRVILVQEEDVLTVWPQSASQSNF